MKIAPLLLACLLLFGCEQPPPPSIATPTISGPLQRGDTALVHYTGTLADGRIFETTEDASALPVIIGSGQLLPALESAFIGMRTGESKSIILSPENAFGAHIVSPETIFQIARNAFPKDIDLKIGLHLNMPLALDSGTHHKTIKAATVTAIDEISITVDSNHPHAGKDLSYVITLVEIQSRP